MKLTLKITAVEAENTKSFVFSSPKKIDRLPGQFMYFTLTNLEEPNTHLFSISSSPTEGNKVQFTTRLRETRYKNALKKLKRGEEITAEGPSGTFILDENEPGPHVLLAGGIGITPFRSIIKYHTDKDLSTPIHLIYSNKTPETTAFRSELTKIAKDNTNIEIDFVYTEKGSGRINKKVINKLVPKDMQSKSTFWVCGPPGFVMAMETLLKELKVDSKKIRTESFTGY